MIFARSDVRSPGLCAKVKLKISFRRVVYLASKPGIDPRRLAKYTNLSSFFRHSSNVGRLRKKGTSNETNPVVPSAAVCGKSDRWLLNITHRHSIPNEYTSVFLASWALNSPGWCSGALHGLDFGNKTFPDSPMVRVEYPKSATFTVIFLVNRGVLGCSLYAVALPDGVDILTINNE